MAKLHVNHFRGEKGQLRPSGVIMIRHKSKTVCLKKKKTQGCKTEF